MYRRDFAGNFQFIGQTNEASYVDTGLTNGTSYCYYVTSFGRFANVALPDSLINDSQIACGMPTDTVPPCPPLLSVLSSCDQFTNTLSWIQPTECAADLLKWKIYYRPTLLAPYALIDSVPANAPERFEHLNLQASVAGCYVITAIDSSLNESEKSNEICVDNCNLYELPNVFTPNGDNVNDRFAPLTGWRFVESIDLIVMNRWGQEVFRTFDPQINWDGKNALGQDLEEGTYYYRIKINFRTLEGIKPVDRSGVVALRR